MASQASGVGPASNIEKQIELVRKLTEKTRQGRIRWDRTPNGLSTLLTRRTIELEASFIRPAPFPPSGRNWAYFSIKDDEGTVILQVQNAPGALLPLLLARDPVRDAVKELYEAVEAVARSKIEKAIDLVGEF